MILLENIDGKIWHIETKVVDMVKEYQDQGKLIISLNSEGPCCEALGLYKILDHMCEKFNIDKTNITIETGNQLESHQFYNIKVVQQVKWTLERVATHLKDWQLESKTDTLKASCSILLCTSRSILPRDFSTSLCNSFCCSSSSLDAPLSDSLKNGALGGSNSNRSLDARLLTPRAPTDWNGVYNSELDSKPSSGINEGIVISEHSRALSR